MQKLNKGSRIIADLKPASATNGHSQDASNPTARVKPLTRSTPFTIADKVKELVQLAQEQGHLTFGDVNDALPDSVVSPDEINEVLVKLRSLEIGQ